MELLIEVSYFATAILFILGLKRMSHPTTARSGIWWAGGGMALATVVSFLHPEIAGNYLLMIIAILIGGAVAWWTGKRVAMTDMPQMIAIYNGMGGGAAGAIAAVELLKLSHPAEASVVAVEQVGNVIAVETAAAPEHSTFIIFLAVLGAMIGTVSFSGSCVAYAKLQGIMKKVIRFPNQQKVNLAIFALMVLLGLVITFNPEASGLWIALFFLLALTFGVLMAVPIGGADMPVIISLFNAFTGLAVAFEGFVLGSSALIIAGTVVGAAGTLLTQLMAKAMNRSINNVLFGAFGEVVQASDQEVTGSMKAMEPMDAAVQMAYASKVIIVPGYGMAVAQAQHKVWELAELLEERGVEVKFAIHPVAGRMPGHMNVLLAEAGVPYDKIFDLEEINNDFETSDVALIIGANDVVNPVARTDPGSPIYGMPILNADKSRNVLVIKRGQGAGFSGIENALFYLDHTHLVYGDGQKVAADLIQHVKTL